MEPITTFGGSVVALPINDIDQIIPARYLKVTDKAGLGAALFPTGAMTPTVRRRPILYSTSRSIRARRC
jgi:3-isopropylmalate/(R)-2-methylmalate dehydratase small subunit